MTLNINILKHKTNLKFYLGGFLIVVASALGFLAYAHTAQAALEEVTAVHDFNDDVVGEWAVGVSGELAEVVDDPTLGQAIRIHHQEYSEDFSGAILEFGNFPYTDQEYQQVSWEQLYTDPSNLSGFILRAQEQGQAHPEVYPYDIRTGYLFQVSTPNDEVNIYKIDAGSPDTLLGTYELSAPGVNTPRWYRATADGETLSFEWSSDNSTWNELGSTTDSTYPQGQVQFVDVGTDGSQIVDNISYTYQELSPEAPDAPTNLTAPLNYDGSVALSWTAPVSDGGSYISDYPVEYKASSSGTWLLATNIENSSPTTRVVKGLTNGTSYDFRVSAVNDIGTSPVSNVATATPSTTPGAPTSLLASRAGSGQITLSWTAPVDNGGSPLDDYIIYLRAVGGNGIWGTYADGTSTATTATLISLVNGTAYEFRVNARNAKGLSYDSSSVVTATPATVPGAPTAVSPTASSGQVALSWAAPASNGGSAITDYRVEYKTAAASSWSVFADGTSTTPSTTVTSLTNGTSYNFRISATNEVGTGVVSATATATPGGVAGAPTSLAATRGNTQAVLTWAAPASDGGFTISDYIVEYKASASATWLPFSEGTSATTGATVTSLTNGVSYDFRVSAVNSVGTGTASTTATATPATVPGLATGLSAVRGATQVVLSWTAPGNNGGSAITDYVVEYKASASATWLPFSDGTSATTGATVTSLTNGTGYDFRVSTINAIGTGSATSTVSATPAAVPGTVGLTITGAQLSAELSWTAAANNGAAITDYIVEYKLSSDSSWTTYNDGVGTGTATTITDLQGGVSYDFRVAAVNAVGTGAFTITGNITPDGIPATIEYEDSDVEGAIIDKRPTFTGTASPLATVIVTVHSDPISCTTTADEDGSWSCTLPSDLPPSQHTVFVSVTPFGGGAAIELGPYTVTVPGETITSITPNTGLAAVNITLYIVAGSVGVILIVLAIGTKHHYNKRKTIHAHRRVR